MTDIFFSYSAKDRERVRPIHEALSALGFEIFWDLQVPTGKDWDTLIKEQLIAARSAIVFWSFASIASDNVRHEATVAKGQGKLVPVMLDALRVEQFPMGLFNTQAARLITWSGDGDDPEWRKLLSEIESKATPVWVGRRLATLDAELRTEAKRREAAQAGEDAAEAQLAQEIGKQGQFRRDREQAQAETKAARAELAGLKEALDAANSQNGDMVGRLASTENLAASARKRFPVWAFPVGIVLALGVGAGGAYFAQEAAWTEREARAVSETRTKVEAETRLKVEAELRRVVEAETRAKVEVERQEAEQRRVAAERQTLPARQQAERDAQVGIQGRQQAEREAREREAAVLAEKKRRLLQNTSLGGTMLTSVPFGKNVEHCRASCLNDAKCKGFELSLLHTCWTYSAITDQYEKPGHVSGRWD